jgi:hypothetical protein
MGNLSVLVNNFQLSDAGTWYRYTLLGRHATTYRVPPYPYPNSRNNSRLLFFVVVGFKFDTSVVHLHIFIYFLSKLVQAIMD